MNIRVIRIKREGESEWQYHYKFYHKTGASWYEFCVQHNCIHCGKCNKCTHLDPESDIGYNCPNTQCIKCCPWIACTNCCMEPQLLRQSSCDPRYRNRCGRCYRLATGNARAEDICIDFIRNSNIPISSANKEVFGLNIRPDAEITASPLNDISYECDDEKGHVFYPVGDQHQRTVELNERRLERRARLLSVSTLYTSGTVHSRKSRIK